MPLAGSEGSLAAELKSSMKNVKDYNAAWEKMAEILLAHMIKNALVVGTCPSGGGPLAAGKLQ